MRKQKTMNSKVITTIKKHGPFSPTITVNNNGNFKNITTY